MLDPDAGFLQVSSQATGDTTVVNPVGDIDLTGSPALRSELKRVFDTKPARIIVDLIQVPYMDSSGVATLVEAMQLSRRAKSKLLLCNLQDRVRGIFEIAKLDMVFTIVADLPAALKA